MRRTLCVFFIMMAVAAGAATLTAGPEISDCVFVMPFGQGITDRPNRPVAFELGVAPSCATPGATIGNIQLALRGRGDGTTETIIPVIRGEVSLRPSHGSREGEPITVSTFRLEHGARPQHPGWFYYAAQFSRSGKEFRTPAVRVWLGKNPPPEIPTVISAQVVADEGGFRLEIAVRNFGPQGELTPVRLRVITEGGFVGETTEAEARPAYLGAGHKVLRAPFPTGVGTVTGAVWVLVLDPSGFQVSWPVERVADALLKR